ncbi:hypothetical protein EGI11_06195 [Chryseobacterium sp. H3056]|uniref:Uncharacterized protein n=1 Tax=Kaistella daneshvariae TaxID=2487074 RepID=A0A3N0WYA1_9FLAO|nr:hypothetical protein EGI11_06195 [Kaistella daneshvariae]
MLRPDLSGALFCETQWSKKSGSGGRKKAPKKNKKSITRKFQKAPKLPKKTIFVQLKKINL